MDTPFFMKKIYGKGMVLIKVMFGSWVLEGKGGKEEAWEEVNHCLRVLKK
jgi:hypothetical protein